MSTIILISGDDEPELQKAATASVSQVAGTLEPGFELDIISCDDELCPEGALKLLLSSIISPPFFGEKTVWLKNFPELAAAAGKNASKIIQELLQDLAEQISAQLPEMVNLIISGVKLPAKCKLINAIQGVGGQLQRFDRPKNDYRGQQRMKQILQHHAAEKKLELSNTALDYLLKCIGTETSLIEVELEKLSCYCGGRSRVSQQDVMAVISGDQAASEWMFVNALRDRNISACLKAVDTLIRRSRDLQAPVRSMLSQCLREFQDMLELKILCGKLRVKHGTPEIALSRLPEDMQRQLKRDYRVASYKGFRMEKLAQASARFSPEELLQGVNDINSSYRKLISSRADIRFILENLTINLLSRSKV